MIISIHSRCAALAAAALLLTAAPSVADDLGLRTTQEPEIQAPAAGTLPETQPADWSALNWDASKLALPDASRDAWASAAPAQAITRDGNAALTAKKTLPSAWDGKVGIDNTNTANQPTTGVNPVDPDRLLPGANRNASDGPAWASVTAPALDAPVSWDKASFDARFDPAHEERKLGTTLSKSVPLNDSFSVTLQNGTSMTQTSTTPGSVTAAIPTPSTVGAAPTPYGASSHYFSSDNTAKLNVLGTGTSFSVGANLSTTDDKWRHSVGAEQKLFENFSVKGVVSETPTGIPDKSISAGWKRTW